MIALIAGLITGIVLALTGAGGGILAVPLLVFGVHQNVAEAAPVALAAVGMAAALGAILGLRKRIVRYRAAIVISLAGMIFSPAGLWLAHHVDNRSLTIAFAFVLLFVAYRTWQRASAPPTARRAVRDRSLPCQRDANSGRFRWTGRCARILTFSGAFVGFLSGLLGVGGGFVMVPALTRYTDLEMDSVVATSLAVIALVSLSAVASSALSASLNWTVALPFAAGSLAGMAGGRTISAQVAGARLQKMFAFVSSVVAVGLMAKVLL